MSERNLKILTTPLERVDIDFRVQKVFKSKDAVWCTILAYKDARTDMKILDAAVGQMGWQNRFERDSKGVLQCGIGIFNDLTSGTWIWKWSNGVPSNFESEKGEYSDAFKRAGFMWGIGRQLYDFPSIFVQMNEKDYYVKADKVYANSRFRPNDWIWKISPDYGKVTAARKYGSSVKEVFNSNPHKKEDVK